MVIISPLLMAPFEFRIFTVTVPGMLPLFQLGEVTEVGDQLAAVRGTPLIRAAPGVVLGPNPSPVTRNEVLVFIRTLSGYTPVTVGCSRVTVGVQSAVYP